jgi:hypothetical protein
MRINETIFKGYVHYITDKDRLRVQFKPIPTERPTYSIQLECTFENEEQWVPVVRADDFHDRPHLDICSPWGKPKKQWLPDQMDNKANMKEAQRYLKENWHRERKRYEKELYG